MALTFNYITICLYLINRPVKRILGEKHFSRARCCGTLPATARDVSQGMPEYRVQEFRGPTALCRGTPAKPRKDGMRHPPRKNRKIIQSHGTTTLSNRVLPGAEACLPRIRNILRTCSRDARSHDLQTDYRLYDAIRNGRADQERVMAM